MRTAIFLGLIILSDSIGHISTAHRIASGLILLVFMIADIIDFFSDKK